MDAPSTFRIADRPASGWREVAVQFLLAGFAALFYFGVRGATEGSVGAAIQHADQILRLERWVHIDIELGAERLIVGHGAFVRVANWIYIFGHWPVIIVTLITLHHFPRPDYCRLRNAMFVSGLIGLLIYVTFPVAPPRLLDPAYHDTVLEYSKAYRLLQPPSLENRYASMPSLHAGWNLLVGLAIFQASPRRWTKVIGVLSPVTMACAVVLTANHYVLDVVVGDAVAVGGWLTAQRWMGNAGPRRGAARSTPQQLVIIGRGPAS